MAICKPRRERALARTRILLAFGPQASGTVRNTLQLHKAPCLQLEAEATKLTETDGISRKENFQFDHNDSENYACFISTISLSTV